MKNQPSFVTVRAQRELQIRTGICSRLSEESRHRSWTSPLVVCDTHRDNISLPSVSSRSLAGELQNGKTDALIVIGDDSLTQRVKRVLIREHEEKGHRPFEYILVPTSYSSRSMSGRCLDSEGFVRYETYLIPDLIILDEQLLWSNDSLSAAMDAASLLVQLCDMLSSSEAGSRQWYLLNESYRLFSAHAYQAVHTRSAAEERLSLVLSSYLISRTHGMSPPGILDLFAQAISSHSDLSYNESLVLAFPYLFHHVTAYNEELFRTFSQDPERTMISLVDHILSPFEGEIARTLHSRSRHQFNHGKITLSDLSTIADSVYASADMASSILDADRQRIIRMAESIYWGYRS